MAPKSPHPNAREVIQVGFVIGKYPGGPNGITQAALKAREEKLGAVEEIREVRSMRDTYYLLVGLMTLGSTCKDWTVTSGS